MEVYNNQTAAVFLKLYGYLPKCQISDLGDAARGLSVGGDSHAVTAMQSMYAEQSLATDGLCGKLTREAMNLPRCAWPDAVDDELADLRVNPDGSPPLRTVFFEAAKSLGLSRDEMASVCAMHNQMRARANNQYRWPLECSQNLIVDYNTAGASSSLDLEWIWNEVRAAHATLGIGCNRGEGRSHIDMAWRRFWGNTIGEAQFPMSSCSDNIFCHLSRSYAPNDVQVGNLMLHENGHNFGESHHARGIMAATMSNNHQRIYWPEDDTAAIALREHYWQGDPEPPEPPPERELKGTCHMVDGTIYEMYVRPEE